ncbi:MAG: glycosyl transferase family 1 [delta proteobacterium ML8_D]|jgi:alpha-maltose-1-phosphate synthase|nr:MAG: glycosyl transferase family 1 [delta proteobacterium ML8_D]
MTREYPPNVYGGAGVHVEYLAREVSRHATVEVKCFDGRRATSGNPSVTGYAFREDVFEGNPRRVRQALMALQTCMYFNAAPVEADIVHCHTWYSMWGGILAKIAYGIPLVATVHSLEPMRPWKREQLGRGYDLSSWVERTALEMADAVIAVSLSDREQILARFAIKPEKISVIPNGVDTQMFRQVATTGSLELYGIDPERPYVLFLGRVSRQKGIDHFLRAAFHFDREIQIVLCAAAPDTAEFALEIQDLVSALEKEGRPIVWIRNMVERKAAIELYSHAAVFCCPSIYEPFGIINLEAMACETPVVASAVGGINDVVVHGETGYLVGFEAMSSNDASPKKPGKFASDLAQRINCLVADAGLRSEMGQRGRKRVVEKFSWEAVAAEALRIYRKLEVSANRKKIKGKEQGDHDTKHT